MKFSLDHGLKPPTYLTETINTYTGEIAQKYDRCQLVLAFQIS